MSGGTNLILVINPGSTSTKFAVFKNEEALFERTVRHPPEDFDGCAGIPDQRGVRMRYITQALQEQGLSLESLNAVVGRGGIVAPLTAGTYEINELLVDDLRGPKAAIHAACLGGLIAYDLGRELGIPAYVVDPPVVDEFLPESRLSGIPQCPRVSNFHALNSRAVARLCANDLGLPYDKARIVVAHLGGGISTSAHRYGKTIDATHGIAGEGPFTPERCGGVYGQDLVEMCFSGQHSKEQILAFMQREGGIKAYLGVNDMREVEKMVNDGHEQAKVVFTAMALQVAKAAATMAVALECRVDAIALTGGIAYSEMFTNLVKKYIEPLAPVRVYPGELEMEALAGGALRVLRGEEQPQTYAGWA